MVENGTKPFTRAAKIVGSIAAIIIGLGVLATGITTSADYINLPKKQSLLEKKVTRIIKIMEIAHPKAAARVPAVKK